MSRYHQGRRGRLSQRQRRAVFTRAGWCCQACGRPGWPLEVDNRVPLHLGGTSAADNLQALCPSCHRDKTRAERGAAPRDPAWDAAVEQLREPHRRR